MATETRFMEAPAPAAGASPAMTTVASLFDRYARQVSPTKGGARWEAIRLKSLARDFPLFAGPVSALDGPALATWRDERLQTVATSTVNRELSLISAVCTRAMKEWSVAGLVANPVRAIQRPKDPPPRTQMVPAAERVKLLRQLGWSGKLAPVGAEQWIAWSFCLALETAMRKGEILGIIWRHVHLDRQFVHLPTTKNSYPRDVALSSASVALFKMIAPGDPDAAVVPVQSGTFTTLFRRAKLDAGLPEIRFHDARREATTMLAAKIGDVLELSGMTGHRSLNVLRRVYYQPDATKLAKKLG